MGLGKREILSYAPTLFRMLVLPWSKPVSRCIQGLVTQLLCGACPGRRCYYYRGEQDEDERWAWHRKEEKGGLCSEDWCVTYLEPRRDLTSMPGNICEAGE